MDTKVETKKRLKIAKNISSQLEGIVRGVLLGGSMGFGQNFSVTDKSDIDMVVVCDKERARDLEKTEYFSGEVPENVLKMFEEEKINLFWVTKYIDTVEVNSFIYETKGYEKFCIFEDGIKGWLPTRPREEQENYGFDGSLITFKRNVTPYENGFLYEKPALVGGKFVGAPPRDDFTRGYFVVYQGDNFFEDMNEKVWNSVLEQLKKEYGSTPDLGKYNVLNSEFVYQRKPEKLPPQAIERIKTETKRRLKNQP